MRTLARSRAPRPSKPIASIAPAASAPIRPKAGAHGESLPVGEHERPHAGADEGADREPDQRERARHEALRPAEQGEEDHDAEDDPVEPCHVWRVRLAGDEPS